MELVRFYALLIKIGILLVLCGQLKSCTLELAGKSAAKHEMMSYSRFTRMLTNRAHTEDMGNSLFRRHR